MDGLDQIASFMDEAGRLTGWPRKYSRKVIAAQYLATKFEMERDYNEAQVNDILEDWHTFNDAAVLRRFMVDLGIMDRERDGRRYWLAAPAMVRGSGAAPRGGPSAPDGSA